MRKIKKSTIILIIILLAYTILSFYKLGNNYNPQTFVNLKDGEQLIYKIKSDKAVKTLTVYTGYNEMYLLVFLATDYTDYDTYLFDRPCEADYANVFKWNTFEINQTNSEYSYIILQSYCDTTVLGEFKLYDENGDEIEVEAVGDGDENLLLDEQEMVPEYYSYMNSTYFDEVYFPRAVYEIINDLPIYEYTHPPLGKLIMSIPVLFFGMTPFAYRLMGNIAGILMILVIYFIAKELLKSEKCALFAAAIMALDGMHFVMTRIGTTDSFLVLFCLTSFLFFIKYLKIDFSEKTRKKMIPLLISRSILGNGNVSKMDGSTSWSRNGNYLCNSFSI